MVGFSTALIPFTQTTEEFVRSQAQKAQSAIDSSLDSQEEQNTISIVSAHLPLSHEATQKTIVMKPMLEMADSSCNNRSFHYIAMLLKANGEHWEKA